MVNNLGGYLQLMFISMTDSFSTLRHKWHQFCDGNPEDTQLLQWLEDFCESFCSFQKCSTGSPEWKAEKRKWQKAFALVCAAISKLPRLYRQKHQDYDDVFWDTVERVRTQLCDEFSPDRAPLRNSFTAWINEKLRHKYRVIDLFRPPKHQSISIDNPVSGNKGTETFHGVMSDQTISGIPKLSGLEQLLIQERQSLRQSLKEYCENDPEGRLRASHSPSYPQWNCQEYALRRYLREKPQKWEDIAKELGIPIGSVSSEQARRFLPLLRKIAQELGYN
jgi:hypothetical protein